MMKHAKELHTYSINFLTDKLRMIDPTKTHIKPVILKGERIILKPVTLSGLNDFHEYSLCAKFYQYLEYPPFKNIDESEAYLKKLIERSKSPLQQYWFVKIIKTGKVIGSFGVNNLNESRKSIEIGYGISPYYWGKGYFNESANLIIEYIFKELKIHRIVARTAAFNKASTSGLTKLGFTQEGIMRDYYKDYNGKRLDAVLFAKLSTD
jgi:ribosomal-protein-alanine N-acetyltransferase